MKNRDSCLHRGVHCDAVNRPPESGLLERTSPESRNCSIHRSHCHLDVQESFAIFVRTHAALILGALHTKDTLRSSPEEEITIISPKEVETCHNFFRSHCSSYFVVCKFYSNLKNCLDFSEHFLMFKLYFLLSLTLYMLENKLVQP